MPGKSKLRYRAVFLSDLHLGSSACRARDAAEFLRRVECDTLYLVGDVIDMWRLRQRWYWPEDHNWVVRRVLKMAKRGTRVVYIPGNHDEHARPYVGLNFGGVEICRDAVHETADGRRLLVTHGDQFDVVVRHARALSLLGAMAYDKLVVVNRWYNGARRLLGLPYLSLAQYIKLRVKSACVHIERFEHALCEEARGRGCGGVICGHIHKAEARAVGAPGVGLDGAATEAAVAGGIEYYNCGDWVEGCTAIVEGDDGTVRVIDGLAVGAWPGDVPEVPEPDDEPIAEQVIPRLRTERWRDTAASLSL